MRRSPERFPRQDCPIWQNYLDVLNAVAEQLVGPTERRVAAFNELHHGSAFDRCVKLNRLINTTESGGDVLIIEDFEQPVHRLAAVTLLSGVDVFSQHGLGLFNCALNDLLIVHRPRLHRFVGVRGFSGSYCRLAPPFIARSIPARA